MVETELSANQTALRTASDAYCENLEAEGWVTASNGFANLASILMHGQNVGDHPGNYTEQFEDTSIPPSQLIAVIAADAAEARRGLEVVAVEVRRVLADDSIETQRGDVTSFERALVRAQRASRSFSKALGIMSERTTATETAESAISAFEAEIDDSRRLADALAARYAALGDTSV